MFEGDKVRFVIRLRQRKKCSPHYPDYWTVLVIVMCKERTDLSFHNTTHFLLGHVDLPRTLDHICYQATAATVTLKY